MKERVRRRQSRERRVTVEADGVVGGGGESSEKKKKCELILFNEGEKKGL